MTISNELPEILKTKPIKLFSKKQVLVSTFFGSIICGAYLIKQNMATSGNKRGGNVILFSSIIATVIFVVLSDGLSGNADKIISKLYIILGIICMGLLYNKKCKATYETHINNGGEVKSNWSVFFAVMKVIVAILISLILYVLYDEFVNDSDA